jgi:methyl-accepting chemotaxis protein
MDKAREIVRQAQGIASEQDRVMARLVEVMRMFQELSERNLRSAESLAGAIAGLQQRAGALGEEVRKFTL